MPGPGFSGGLVTVLCRPLSSGLEDRALASPGFHGRSPVVCMQRGPAPTWRRAKMFRWLTDMLTPRPHPYPSMGSSPVQRDGFPRVAVGQQHQHPRGSFPLQRPAGHLESSNQSSLRGTAQPCPKPQGPGIPVALAQVSVGTGHGGLTPAGRRGASCNPSAQDPPASPPTQPPGHPGWVASPRCGGKGASPARRERQSLCGAVPIPSIRKSFCTTTRCRDIF